MASAEVTTRRNVTGTGGMIFLPLPQNSYVEVLTPVPQNGTYLQTGFKKVSGVGSSVLIRSGELDRDAQSIGPVETEGDGSHL